MEGPDPMAADRPDRLALVVWGLHRICSILGRTDIHKCEMPRCLTILASKDSLQDQACMQAALWEAHLCPHTLITVCGEQPPQVP